MKNILFTVHVETNVRTSVCKKNNKSDIMHTHQLTHTNMVMYIERVYIHMHVCIYAKLLYKLV